MGFKLTKDEAARKAELLLDLQAQYDKLEDAINTYRAEEALLREPVVNALDAYNELVDAARGFAEDVANRAETEYDEKSEKWQEGDRGEAAREWKDAWDNVNLDEIEIEWPDELSVDDPGHATELDGLPEEMEA